MSELKTLKDILSPDNDWDETSEAKCGEAIRQEAIKWIKERESQNRCITPSDWEDFFNLTDEDLK